MPYSKPLFKNMFVTNSPNYLTIRDASDPDNYEKIATNTNKVYPIDFSPDKKHVAFQDKSSICIVDTETIKRCDTVDVWIGSDTSWSPNGVYISVPWHSCILNNVKKHRVKYIRDDLGNAHFVHTATWCPDSKHIVIGIQQDYCDQFSLEKVNVVDKSIQKLGDHEGTLKCIRCSPRGDKLSVLTLTELRLYNLDDIFDCVVVQYGQVNMFSWNPNNNTLAYAFKDQIRLFNTETKRYCSLTYESQINCLDWNDIGTKIVSCNRDKTITVWNGKTKKIEKTMVDNDECRVVKWQSSCSRYQINELFLLAVESAWNS